MQRTLVVRADADPAVSDGSDERPYREIRDAIHSLKAYGPVLVGTVTVDVGPGEYRGGIRLPQARSMAQDDFIRIVGAAKDGVPTARIVHEPGDRVGILAEDGKSLWLENLKFVGGFAVAAQLTRNCYGWFANIHVDGEGVGARGISVSAHSRYYVRGGRIENLSYAGIDEYFSCSRSFATTKSYATQMLVRNCKIGLRAKEGCVGHLDYLQVEDCAVGIELLQNSVANMKKVAIRRNGTGLMVTNSATHNERSILWGEGPDANGREVYSVGMSGELRAIMWSGESMAVDGSTGHRPLLSLANDYAQRTIVSKRGLSLPVAQFSEVLPYAFFRTVGKHFLVNVVGAAVNASVSSTVQLALQVDGVEVATVNLDSNDTVRIEFDSVCTVSQGERMTTTTVNGAGSSAVTVFRSMDVLSGSPSSVGDVALFARLTDAGQAFQFHSCEVFG